MGNKANIVNHINQYATTDELDWLTVVAKNLPDDGQVVMLGAGPGVMAVAVRDGNTNIAMHIVDHNTCHYARAYLESFDYYKNITTLIAKSYIAGMMWDRNKKIDLLIIDADHSYEAVKSDLLAWLPHLCLGGLVFFHDYDATGTVFAAQDRYPGVRQAVEETMIGQELICRVGTSIVYRKMI